MRRSYSPQRPQRYIEIDVDVIRVSSADCLCTRKVTDLNNLVWKKKNGSFRSHRYNEFTAEYDLGLQFSFSLFNAVFL